MSEDEQQSPSESTATTPQAASLSAPSRCNRRFTAGASSTYASEIYGTKPIFLKKINETVRMVARFSFSAFARPPEQSAFIGA